MNVSVSKQDVFLLHWENADNADKALGRRRRRKREEANAIESEKKKMKAWKRKHVFDKKMQ